MFHSSASKGMPIAEKLEAMSCPIMTGCVIWLGARAKGYGRVHHDGVVWQAHRLAWTVKNGAPPPDMELDHLCRNRECINPEHLEPVTTRENLLRGTGWSARNARKTHCPRGHAYDAKEATGSRRCRACKNLLQNQRYAERGSRYARPVR